MTVNAFAVVAADEFPLDFPDAPTPLCQELRTLVDAELAELVRLPWRHARLPLDIGPEPKLRCGHEHGHPGRHVAFGAESGKRTFWVSWDGQGSHIFPADYCRRESGAGRMCVLPDGHAGRHAIGWG